MTTDGLKRWVDPADKDGDAATNRKYERLEIGTRVLLVKGPTTIERVDYWQVYPEFDFYQLSSLPLGWVAASGLDGAVNLAPHAPPCPPAESASAASIGALSSLEALACFGNRELSLSGTVTCSYVIGDGFLAGPMLSSTTPCGLDESLSLFGHAITDLIDTSSSYPPRLNGTFAVRGHFDDPGAQYCYQTPFGTSLEGSRDPGDPAAIQECRTLFVVTWAEELTIQ